MTGGRPEWRVEPGLVDYAEAVAFMEARAAAIADGRAGELAWLLQHPPTYTAGTSAKAEELIGRPDIPRVATGRGGRWTYHGPGQRVAYLMLDLNARGRDIRRFVACVEAWGMAALGRLGVEAFTIPGDVGLWVMVGGRPAKIGAVGIRVRRWATFHGMALNVDPALADFAGIVPCGIADRGVTSLAALGTDAGMAALDAALAATFDASFGPPPHAPAAASHQRA